MGGQELTGKHIENCFSSEVTRFSWEMPGLQIQGIDDHSGGWNNRQFLVSVRKTRLNGHDMVLLYPEGSDRC